ncbi:MAG TPA: TolC family protein, partial [Bacteroidales bacterium]|nr:TolC family protein [Bacteroidales bacterium]
DAEYNLTDTKKNLYKAIQQAHADAVNAFQNYMSRKEAVISSAEAFKYTQQKYEVGLSSAVDFNIAKTNLMKANSDLLQSKYEYIFKNKILDFYKGVALKI